MASRNWNNKGVRGFHFKQMQDVWVPPTRYHIPYRYYSITADDAGRLDRISFRVYGSEEYFWVLAQFNNILDPFNGFIVGQIIKVPELNDYLRLWKFAGYR